MSDRMQETVQIGIAAFLHFVVDFTCAYWMMYIVNFQGTVMVSGCFILMADYRYLWFMVYHFCAMALQFPLGWLTDRHRLYRKNPWQVACLGCLLLGMIGGIILLAHLPIGYDLSSPERFEPRQMFGYAILLGIGNALFHVGAGMEMLHLAAGENSRKYKKQKKIALEQETKYRIAPLGVFLSSGGPGVYLGRKMAMYIGDHRRGDWEEFSSYSYPYVEFTCFCSLLVIGFLFLAGGIYFFLHWKRCKTLAPPIKQKVMSESKFDKKWAADHFDLRICFLLLLVSALYSCQSGFMEFSWFGWKKAILLSALFMMAGKVAGGILADRIGLFWTLGGSLSCSAILFCLASDRMVPGLSALLLWQMAVPVVISLMHRQLPENPGAALGLLGIGSFLGSLPKTAVRMQEIAIFLFDKNSPIT